MAVFNFLSVVYAVLFSAKLIFFTRSFSLPVAHSFTQTRLLNYAFQSPRHVAFATVNSAVTESILLERKRADRVRQQWISSSLDYYSKVMREERRRSMGQIKSIETEDPQYYKVLAKKHYFALRKIKDGKPEHAEHIYRRIINELFDESYADHECDHSKLAVTTLLLALHLQRNGESPKKTRSVFLDFFRVVTSSDEPEECACSAKVLQAFALFEMKQGNSLKSLELVTTAIKLDPALKPVLNWKVFRDAMQKRQALKP